MKTVPDGGYVQTDQVGVPFRLVARCYHGDKTLVPMILRNRTELRSILNAWMANYRLGYLRPEEYSLYRPGYLHQGGWNIIAANAIRT
jgi:hypothetical protein